MITNVIQTNVAKRLNLWCECAFCHKIDLCTKQNEFFSYHPRDPESFIYCLTCYFNLNRRPDDPHPVETPTENPLAFFDTR